MALLLLLFISTMAILHLVMPDRAFSEPENRVLEVLPTFSLQSLLSGKFTSNYEKYVSDQIPFRDVWIGMKTDADRAMGRRESNGVYLGKDGYLIQSFTPPTDGDMEEKIAAIHSFDSATPSVRKHMMLVPTAASLYKDKLPAFAPVADQLMYLDQVRQALRPTIRFVDVYPALNVEREQSIFYKTDHHWTTKGAFYAYRELCKSMGIAPKDAEDFNIRLATNEFYGSLYSKSGFKHIEPDRIELYLPKDKKKYRVEYVDERQTSNSLYEMEHLDKKDKYAVFLNGNHGLVKITTNHPEGKKLLVVKDSYANSLIPFLAEHFSEVYVVDLRYCEENLISFVQEHRIPDVLLLYNANTFFEDSYIKNISEVSK
ncbi:hypothetical protein LOK74_09145 [Brevibacillus humidisoli]|uniref:DHHW family protein n=1 Tax=Brevibacillus humidisoli TaxID=2895522 RepID=UPI001E61F7E9|nr:DHHW family protein [Brevibacillus humidisoli]UFJ42638.1 hypothetical protein LOK74_09145 [Brevibacillus humidisoli]